MLATGLGHRESALAAIEEATAIRRKLADARPGVFLHRCAASLDNLATGFRRWGRGPEAAAALAEATRTPERP